MDKEAYLTQEPNLPLYKKIKWGIWISTTFVYILVGLMRRPEKLDLGIDFSFLPPVHAIINTLVAIFLITALIAVKAKNISLHKASINIAMILSILFLLCYVTYHFTTAEVRFLGQGNIRSLYFLILISHIVLAGISLPIILFTWAYGFTNQFQKHRKIAKFIFPIWLYVAITGPICYLMLKPYY